jgi:hypothetical protein
MKSGKEQDLFALCGKVAKSEKCTTDSDISSSEKFTAKLAARAPSETVMNSSAKLAAPSILLAEGEGVTGK